MVQIYEKAFGMASDGIRIPSVLFRHSIIEGQRNQYYLFDSRIEVINNY